MIKSYSLITVLFFIGLLFFSGCTKKGPLVENFKLDNTTVAFSYGKPLRASAGRTLLSGGIPPKEMGEKGRKEATKFVFEMSQPLQEALKVELKKHNIKVSSEASHYRIMKFMTAMQAPVPPSEETKVLLKKLQEQEMASGTSESQPDMILNIYVHEAHASLDRRGTMDQVTIYMEASIVTIEGPGADIGKIWNFHFNATEDFDTQNNEELIGYIVSRIIGRLEYDNIISS